MPDRKKKIVGSVMVVGGGIGGMQSSLDLANSGFKVYLLESSSVIGGHMAQLDKTFPTNDCSMCIISPKLVEVGSHPNIELITYADLLAVDGEPGNFNVSIKKRARYIDLDKCTGCGACFPGCPVTTKSEFNMGLSDRKAIYIPFPQAVPNKAVIDKREERPCNAACMYACPINTNVPGYLKLISEGLFKDAYSLIRSTNPLSIVCGRVCYAPCESVCNRGQMDEPLAIRHLKRFATDVDTEGETGQSPLLEAPQIQKTGKKVAVIGAGPGGLACANDLALKGHAVTIFEALPEPGGMLRYAIPEYRLPKMLLAKEIGYIKKLGVEIKCNVKVGSDIPVSEIKNEYDAVFIATGAPNGLKMGVEGEDNASVMDGIKFLRAVNSAEKIKLGNKAAVIGGGNTAVDCARSLRHLGCEDVRIIYRRSKKEMPAQEEEVKAAEEEGVSIDFLTVPKRFISQNGKVAAMECIKMKLGEPDANGRAKPIAITGSEFSVPVDMVILALGQTPETEFINGLGISSGKDGFIKIDPDTCETSIKSIFAGGDAVTGPAYVIDAIAAGKNAATSIDRYFKGEIPAPKEERKEPERLPDEKISILKKTYKLKNRIKEREEPSLERIKDFRETVLGYTQAEAMEEASRCLAGQIEGCIQCFECKRRCDAKAINYQDKDEIINVNVGSIVLSPGFDAFDPAKLGEFGYGRYKNVVTSLEFERILSASGPFSGEVVRPSDKQHPHKIAWIQCVGSRNTSCGNDYCSSVCCMYATKQAIIAKEHDQAIQPTIFYMDIRAFGKDFDSYYERARDQYGVRYIRSMISGLYERSKNKNLFARYIDKDGSIKEEEFDMVVLSIGMVPSREAIALSRKIGIDMDEFSFCKTSTFNPLETSRQGIYVCGAFQSPKDIPETVAQASGAAAYAAGVIASARGELIEFAEYPPERDVSGEDLRIGVFVCHCGINIAGVVDVKAVRDYATTQHGVVFADNLIYTCSQDALKKIIYIIKEQRLNRIVVASCSPRTHEPLFQSALREAGLNKYLFEMANIRDQCSWVHMSEKAKATEKAKDLVRMAVANAALLSPLKEITLDVNHKGLVIGGGHAGMVAALKLADQGFAVTLVEKEGELGGNLRDIFYTIHGDDVQQYMKDLIERVESNPLITVIKNAEIDNFEGYKGNFKTSLLAGPGMRPMKIEHGITIVATGADESVPAEYLYGKNKNVLTQKELERKIVFDEASIKGLKEIVMIQCVGSRNEERPYCSRICCSHAIKNAIKIKQVNPDIKIYILNRDIRTYGLLEKYYTYARETGVVFIKYELDNKPQVIEEDGSIKITIRDNIIRSDINLKPDLLVLSSAIVPKENEELSGMLKIPRTMDNFYLEAHMKLRPVDFSTEGIYLTGMAHLPKLIEETISQSAAAAARAATVLSKDKLQAESAVAKVTPELCAVCLTCVRVCPFGVPFINSESTAEINPLLCQGCGTCVSECPGKAIELQHYRDVQILAKCEKVMVGVA